MGICRINHLAVSLAYDLGSVDDDFIKSDSLVLILSKGLERTKTKENEK